MSDAWPLTPLLLPGSPLDAEARDLIADLHDREHALVQGLGGDEALDPERRRRVELTLPELLEQPQVIRATLDREHDAIRSVARDLATHPLDRICLVGCGDSLAAMLAVRAWFEGLLSVPCEPVQALDLAYYHRATLGPRTLVITLSSSGSTTRTVEAMLVARAAGARTLALSNTPGSALMTRSDAGLRIHAERKGWPTQATTAAMAVLYRLAVEVARARGGDRADIENADHHLTAAPDAMARVISEAAGPIAAVARSQADNTLYLYAGGGPSYAAALVGAAKVRECSPDHAIAIPLEEYHHYNSQKAGDPLFLIAPHGPSVCRALDTAREGRRWGGLIYAVATEGDLWASECADAVITLPDGPEELSPLLGVIPLQLFAYHVAMEKFRLAELAASP